VGFEALGIVFLLLYGVFMDCVFEDNAVELGEVDVFGVRVARQGCRVLLFRALAELGHLLVFVSIGVV
jgi:hypothetical protein